MQGDADLAMAPFVPIPRPTKAKCAGDDFRLDIEHSDGFRESRYPVSYDQAGAEEESERHLATQQPASGIEQVARLYRQDPAGDVLVKTYEQRTA
jgi:hypothetical protein